MKNKQIHLWLLILFIISIFIVSIKYYLMFFSKWDKNIKQSLQKIEQSLQTESGILKEITYKQLITTYQHTLLSNIKLWQVNLKDGYIKIWKDRYYIVDYNNQYPGIINWFKYWDDIDLEYILYKDKRYVTWITKYKNLSTRKTKEYLLVWDDKILWVQKVLDWGREYRVIYNRFTEFREKWTLIKVKNLTEYLNKFNSNTTNYKIVRLEGVIDDNVVYASKVVYWIIYEDEKKILTQILIDFDNLKSEESKNIKLVKEYGKSLEYDNLINLFKTLWLEYDLNKSIYANINILKAFYNTKKKEILNRYSTLF